MRVLFVLVWGGERSKRGRVRAGLRMDYGVLASHIISLWLQSATASSLTQSNVHVAGLLALIGFSVRVCSLLSWSSLAGHPSIAYLTGFSWGYGSSLAAACAGQCLDTFAQQA